MRAIAQKRHAVPERKRRVHAKSKKGCGNCKLRRVKCDEARPHCRKCKSYGVSCDYGGFNASLDLPAQGSFQVDLTSQTPIEQVIELGTVTLPGRASRYFSESTSSDEEVHHLGSGCLTPTSTFWTDPGARPLTPISINSAVAAMVDDSLQYGLLNLESHRSSGTSSWSPTPFWHFSESHLEIMERFQERTAMTIGNKQMASAYSAVICQLAFTHAFLMHMLLSLTLMHDSDLSLSHSPALAAKQKHASLQHWNAATTLFNRILAEPIPPSYRDAIWATGVILGAASFWYVESTKPEEVWPLKPSDPEDLAWIKLGEGKRHLWRIADPTRPESLFSYVMKDRPCAAPPEWMHSNDTSRIPDSVKQIFNITSHSTILNNVYQLPVLILSHIQHMHLTYDNSLNFLYMTAFITPEFLGLLETKDPRAVFLLGWWFKMVQDGDLWWMARRAKIEGEAVRIWLYRQDIALAKLLNSMDRCSVAKDVTMESPLPDAPWAHPWNTIEASEKRRDVLRTSL